MSPETFNKRGQGDKQHGKLKVNATRKKSLTNQRRS